MLASLPPDQLGKWTWLENLIVAIILKVGEVPVVRAERGRFELEAWMQVFEKPPSEELLISVIEKAGANCGQALTVQTLFDILARAKSAKPPEVASQPVPKKRKRTVT
jgi:hypothetical protein